MGGGENWEVWDFFWEYGNILESDNGDELDNHNHNIVIILKTTELCT